MSSEESAMVLYQYGRLNPDQFRVLDIIEFEPVVLAKLTHHDDNVPTTYHALSYAWGDQPPAETIECDGQQIKVTCHLLEGLKSIHATTGISVIWVDAICINQEDDNEKASQVAKMHRIYRENLRGSLAWVLEGRQRPCNGCYSAS